ncbi:beta-galactosidase [bacterium]|nr:beta-galactosidase [bacterium]
MLRKNKLIIISVLFLIFVISVFLTRFYENRLIKKNIIWGITFSPKRAETFGLNWKRVYQKILSDLRVKKLRLSAYWPEIEKKKGVYDFSDLDWQIEKAENNNASIILAIGMKLPGWPECHLPKWAKEIPKKKQEEELLKLITKIVNRYKDNSSIKYWQVENEPFLSHFGLCPNLDRKFFEKELLLVKKLDKRKIIVTESGELSSWLGGAHYGDILGITMYRVVWNKYFKYFRYPWSPIIYHLKANLIKKLTGIKKIIVVELQAEPWSPNLLSNTSLEKQLKIMNLKKFQNTIKYAQRTGFNEFYLWGVEWWYWLKNNDHPEIWNEAKKLFAQ